MKLKTDIWNNPNWQEKLEKLSFLYGIISLANITVGLALKNIPILVINALQFLITIIITLSYNKWKQKRAKEEEEWKKQ